MKKVLGYGLILSPFAAVFIGAWWVTGTAMVPLTAFAAAGLVGLVIKVGVDLIY